VELHDSNVLVVSGERATHHEARNNQGKVWRQERTFSKFVRHFTLPEDAMHDGITARLEHGVLSVTVSASHVLIGGIIAYAANVHAGTLP
jgi:HSP20 family protein